MAFQILHYLVVGELELTTEGLEIIFLLEILSFLILSVGVDSWACCSVVRTLQNWQPCFKMQMSLSLHHAQ